MLTLQKKIIRVIVCGQPRNTSTGLFKTLEIFLLPSVGMFSFINFVEIGKKSFKKIQLYIINKK